MAALALLIGCSNENAPPGADLTKDVVRQGFEVDALGWNVEKAITRVKSGEGTLELSAAHGDYYAEIQNSPGAYPDQPNTGDAGYSYFGGKGLEYNGGFYQSIAVYVDVTWKAPANPSVPAFWIDMTPHHEDPANYGAEHNFQLSADGTKVTVRFDGVDDPKKNVVIKASGWYRFLMTFEKDPTCEADPCAKPVVTTMAVIGPNTLTLGEKEVVATSPGGPFKSSDLRGNGYVWITVWQNGFADDVLAIDDVETAALPF